MKRIVLACVSSLLLGACAQPKEQPTGSGMLRSDFQMEKDGKQTDLFVLKNKNGMEVCITNLGGRIVSVLVPDINGEMKDVVLGFDNVSDYVDNPQDFGATIGRYANRIGNARFSIDGIEYRLPKNNGEHCLHGGPEGFQYAVFDAVQKSDNELELTYLSKDGEMGFPGNLTCKVDFTLTDDNAIDIRYEAETDAKTVVNLTNHSYFNLDGDPTKNNSDYLVTMVADSFTPIDSTFATTGVILPVEGSDMDFRTATRLGDRIDHTEYDQIRFGRGYDHNYVLNAGGDIDRLAARVESPASGIVLEVYTVEPGLQIYAGNFLDGTLTGKKGIVYNHRTAVCLESQKYPDTPNKPDWPTAQLNPGEKYTSRCIFKFPANWK